MERVLATPIMAGLDAGEVPLMAAVAESPNTPSPCDDKYHGWVEKLEEVMAKLGVVDFGQWHGDNGARAGWSHGGNGGLLLHLGEHTKENRSDREQGASGQLRGSLEALTTRPVGPWLAYGHHGMTMQRSQPKADRPFPPSVRFELQHLQ
jgi:hypothetical protein